MKDDDKKDLKDKPFQHEGHRPVSRRDFLSQGFISGAAFTVAPSLLSIASGSAHAAVTCPNDAGLQGLTPVLIIDLAGGSNMAGSNVMVGGRGGQLDYLLDYGLLGLPPEFHPKNAGQLNTELGLAFHADSGILRGFKSATTAATRNQMDGGIFCTSSGDDTENNQLNPIYWMNKAGAKGKLNQLAGSRRNTSGGKSKAPADSIVPALAPVGVATSQDAVNLVSLGRATTLYAAETSASKFNKILESIANISMGKVDSISRRALPDALKNLVQCSLLKTPDQIKKFSAADLDPRLDPDVAAAFPGVIEGNRMKAASIAKLVIDGVIGVGTLELGGYDYHNDTRASGEVKDFDAGAIMGSIMELAARKKKDMIIYVITDGSTATNMSMDPTVEGRGKFNWTSDRGQSSAAYMLVYKKDGKPSLRNAGRQIGAFKANGAVDTTASLISNNTIVLSKAMVANYLALHGQEGKLAEVVGDNPFGSALGGYLLFDKLR